MKIKTIQIKNSKAGELGETPGVSHKRINTKRTVYFSTHVHGTADISEI